MYGMVSMAILYFSHQRLSKYGFQGSFNPQLPNSRGCPYPHCGPPRPGGTQSQGVPCHTQTSHLPHLPRPCHPWLYATPPTTLGDAWLPLLEMTEAQGEAELPKFESFPRGMGRVWSTKGQGSRRPGIAPTPRLEHECIHPIHIAISKVDTKRTES